LQLIGTEHKLVMIIFLDDLYRNIYKNRTPLMRGASGGVLRWSGSEREPELRLCALSVAVGGGAGCLGSGACGRGSHPRLREASGSPSDPTTRVCRYL